VVGPANCCASTWRRPNNGFATAQKFSRSGWAADRREARDLFKDGREQRRHFRRKPNLLGASRAVETDLFEGLVDFFERLFAEVRDAQEIFPRAM